MIHPRAADPPRALAMLSGGLDSTLAVALVLRQGIDMVGVNFSTGFCLTDHSRQVHRKGVDPRKLRNEALRAGGDFHIPVEIIDVSGEYLDVLRHPRYGYGKNVNPCIDCRIFMMRRARERMEEIGAAFLFTGEVLGQRPKSQHRRALDLIARESGLSDRLVRPLSARLLPPTAPERDGLLDRAQLMDFHGRDRNPQYELAEKLGVTDFPQPAGGCCSLTDPNYAVRVYDLFEHLGKDELQQEDMVLCKVGRHLRVSGESKVVVGRFEEENHFLEGFAFTRPRLEVVEHPGPVSLIDGPRGGSPSPEVILTAARITARYSSVKREPRVRVCYRHRGEEQILDVRPYRVEECEAWLLR